MTSGVRTLWGEILEILHRRAELTAGTLREPRPGEIERAEAQLSLTFPEELREWWSLHDGQRRTEGERPTPGSVLPTFDLVSPTEAAAKAVMMRQIWDDLLRDADVPNTPLPVAGVPAHQWIHHFVPIGDDRGGEDLVVDLRGGPDHGCLMSFDKVECDYFGVQWPSIEHLLSDVLEVLRTGGSLRGWVPSFEDGALRWDLDVEALSEQLRG
ncbi:cell wall assembly regulator SMI1 [Mumia flava]|uniref:Cell wall assembly regulator SMI1 n=1 Tax=Mumia flava TaxID=1348852 RepID=A0A0B2BNU2_9ACTN|nr:SMI1/KNR4 family protein [Mumia flava]PJJ57258.1 cell wall assembly regulator SMI1 [Mumia flava]